MASTVQTVPKQNRRDPSWSHPDSQEPALLKGTSENFVPQAVERRPSLDHK